MHNGDVKVSMQKHPFNYSKCGQLPLHERSVQIYTICCKVQRVVPKHINNGIVAKSNIVIMVVAIKTNEAIQFLPNLNLIRVIS